jgi:hypothetical protein
MDQLVEQLTGQCEAKFKPQYWKEKKKKSLAARSFLYVVMFNFNLQAPEQSNQPPSLE